MNASSSAVSWTDWLRAEGTRWLFVLRTVLATLLALAIAFRFDLSTPGSAAVTVSIIALPQTGMVLEKSFYRLLGTFLGAVVTLILLANFVQQRDTFILAVAVWIGLCTAASTWFRGFQAYGWLLCGYTTCLIGFPAFQDATHAFDIAVDRVTIVGVGILSAGVVNAVILPSRSTTTLVARVRGAFTDFVAFLDAATRPGDAPAVHATQHRFSRDLAAIESIRAASLFEDPISRIRSPRLFGFIGSFMSASSRLHLLHRQLDALHAQGRADVAGRFEPLLRSLRDSVRVAGRVPASALEAAPLAAQLQTVLDRMERDLAQAADDTVDPQGRLAVGTLSVLLREAVEETRRFAAVYADIHSLWSSGTGVPNTRPPLATDARQAGMSGLRAALVVVVTCGFWIASAWPEGFSMTLIGVVGCALFSAAPNPAQGSLQMCRGFVVALVATLVSYTWVLPAANDFASLALGLTPFIAFGAWWMSRPGHALAGSGYFLMYMTGLTLSGRMTYDFIGMFNNSLGLLLGIGVATLSLVVVGPANRAWRPQRARQMLLRSPRMALDGTLVGLQARFESRVRDLTVQLGALRDPRVDPADDEALGLNILEVGDALIRLRKQAGDAARGDVEEMLIRVTEAVERGDRAALHALDATLNALGGSPQAEVALAVLRLALADLEEAAHAA